jgi:hypothetical protein
MLAKGATTVVGCLPLVSRRADEAELLSIGDIEVVRLGSPPVRDPVDGDEGTDRKGTLNGHSGSLGVLRCFDGSRGRRGQ